MRPPSVVPLLLLVSAVPSLPAQDTPLRLTVYVVGARDDDATTQLLELVRRADHLPRLVERAHAAPDALRTADVVLVDWPAADALGERQPLGPLDRWDRPTVFVGGAGDVFARRWGLPTAAEIAAMPAAARGPEMQELAPGVWRQGHLVHFAAAAPWGEAERQALLRVVARTARFVSDRPIVRHPAPAGAAVDGPEQARVRRVDAACRLFAVAADDLAALRALPDRLDGTDRATAARLLVDLVPNSRDEQATKNTWKSWLDVHAAALVWDPLGRAWRVDPVAFWRGVATADCRGDDRADGTREPLAAALAAKVVQRHGGRALADLATFSCWHGNVHVTWDRRRGYLRLENFGELAPGAFGTAWTVSVLDTAADAEVIWGGGPPPRPRVSAGGGYRDLVERVFLPAMLLDPGTSLRRLPEQDGEGRQAIAVRLAGRGMDLAVEHVLLVDPATGDVAAMRRLARGRVQVELQVAAVGACGPLLVPVELAQAVRSGERRYRYEELKWNPEVPAAIATATERLVAARGK